MDLILDEARFQFPTFPKVAGFCRMRVWRDGEKFFAVASEREDNPSSSITNSAEMVWSTLTRKMGWDAEALKNVHFYEFYPRESGRHRSIPESLSEVLFSKYQPSPDRRRPDFHNPQWAPVERAHFESYLDAALASYAPRPGESRAW